MTISEESLYPDVKMWLETRLRVLFPRWSVEAFDTSRSKLSAFLDRRGLAEFFPGSDGFEIYVDVTGVLRRGSDRQLAFVECKCTPITLRDVGQILGYSRVARPVLALIVSPAGLSAQLNLLLTTYNRMDLLDYAPAKRLKVAAWDMARKQIHPESVIPTGELG